MTVVTLSAGAELAATPAEAALLSGVVAGGDAMAEDDGTDGAELAATPAEVVLLSGVVAGGDAMAEDDGTDGVEFSVSVTGQIVVERAIVTVVRTVERSG
jgi:hypothetical protein